MRVGIFRLQQQHPRQLLAQQIEGGIVFCKCGQLVKRTFTIALPAQGNGMGESKHGELDVRMPLAGFADEAFHLCQIALESAWRALRAGRFAENGWIPRTCSVDGGVGLDDDFLDRIQTLNRAKESERTDDPFLSLGVLPAFGCRVDRLEMKDDIWLNIEDISGQCQSIE